MKRKQPSYRDELPTARGQNAAASAACVEDSARRSINFNWTTSPRSTGPRGDPCLPPALGAGPQSLNLRPWQPGLPARNGSHAGDTTVRIPGRSRNPQRERPPAPLRPMPGRSTTPSPHTASPVTSEPRKPL
ncbi:hypothetical protein H8959_014217 [Pygathrix nigripes]